MCYRMMWHVAASPYLMTSEQDRTEPSYNVAYLHRNNRASFLFTTSDIRSSIDFTFPLPVIQIQIPHSAPHRVPISI